MLNVLYDRGMSLTASGVFGETSKIVTAISYVRDSGS